MTNPTVRLFRAIYFASERERGVTAKDKMTHALCSLAVLVPGPAVRTLALKACERYCESSGSNNFPLVCRAAAATIRAIAVRAASYSEYGNRGDVNQREHFCTDGIHNKGLERAYAIHLQSATCSDCDIAVG